MRLMMINDGISERTILVSYKLKSAWKVATRGRWTLLVVNLDGMVHPPSVARFVHVIISDGYSQVIVWHRVCVPSKCGRALFFNLQRPNTPWIVLYASQASVKVVQIVAGDCAGSCCQIDLNFGTCWAVTKPAAWNALCPTFSLVIRGQPGEKAPSAFTLPCRLT